MRLVALIPLILLIACSTKQSTQVIECNNPLIDSVSVVTCISIIDGDTWKMQIKNDVFSIRVLGIDCFETKHNARLQEQADSNHISTDSAFSLGLRAKFLADSMLTGKAITIVRDYTQDNQDVYNRLLRHCYLKGMLNYAEYIKQQGLNAK